MRLPGFTFKSALSAAAAVLLILWLFLPFSTYLVMENFRTGDILYSRRLASDMEFSISYIHSVNISKITDFFKIRQDGTIVLTSSHFYSFGAGVAAVPEYGGLFSVNDSYISYDSMDRVIDNLVVFVGTVSDHIFHYRHEDIPLKNIAPPQTNIRFTAQRLSPAEIALNYFKKGFFHGKT